MIKTILLCILIAVIAELIFYFRKRNDFWKYLRNRIIYYIVCIIVVILFF